MADLITYAFVGGEYLDSFCSTYHVNTLFSIILHIISDPIIRTYYLTAFESQYFLEKKQLNHQHTLSMQTILRTVCVCICVCACVRMCVHAYVRVSPHTQGGTTLELAFLLLNSGLLNKLLFI